MSIEYNYTDYSQWHLTGRQFCPSPLLEKDPSRRKSTLGQFQFLDMDLPLPCSFQSQISDEQNSNSDHIFTSKERFWTIYQRGYLEYSLFHTTAHQLLKLFLNSFRRGPWRQSGICQGKSPLRKGWRNWIGFAWLSEDHGQSIWLHSSYVCMPTT